MDRVFRILASIPFRGVLGKAFNVISPTTYMHCYVKHLRSLGIQILGNPTYIASDAYFDSHDYSLITIGDSVTISREVMLLTHDYSVARALQAIGPRDWSGKGTPRTVSPICIGSNCFIGARASLLPGTTIGSNCIIGACAVVKGTVPENSIVVGNPARIIANTIEWAAERQRRQDYLV